MPRIPNLLAAIGRNCSLLKNLALSDILHFMPLEHGPEPTLFFRLEVLELCALDGVQLSADVVKQLLGPCQHIRNVLLRGCDAVTDTFLAQVWQVSRPRYYSFSYLTTHIDDTHKNSVLIEADTCLSTRHS